jgi:ribokinase
VTIVLNPAPACPLPDEVFPCVDYITPNETELIAIAPGAGDMQARMRALRGKGAGAVIAKCGADGAYILSAEGFRHARGFRVKPVDTTAAGDTFNAGFAYALAAGMGIFDAAAFANAAAAISVTAPGAQGGMPTREMVDRLVRKGEDDA